MSPLWLRYTSYRNFFYLWVRCQSCRKEKLVQILRVVVGVRAAQEIVGCVELGGIAFGLGGVIVRLSFFFITFAKILPYKHTNGQKRPIC